MVKFPFHTMKYLSLISTFQAIKITRNEHINHLVKTQIIYMRAYHKDAIQWTP